MKDKSYQPLFGPSDLIRPLKSQEKSLCGLWSGGWWWWWWGLLTFSLIMLHGDDSETLLLLTTYSTFTNIYYYG